MLNWGRQTLRGKVEHSARDASCLLSHVLKLPQEHLYVYPETPVTEADQALYKDAVNRRAQGEPLAYIRGYKEFMGMRIKVNRHVLIPRPETELLVETALDILRGHAKEGGILADVGCGSGAIGLSLGKKAGNPVILTDTCPHALQVARANARDLGVSSVTFLQGNLLEPLFSAGFERSLFMLLSNPPYVPRESLDSLPETVKRFEPRLALDGGVRGLDYLPEIVRHGPKLLVPGGYLLLELDPEQVNACKDAAASRWEKCRVIKDYAGLDRIFVCQGVRK